MPLERIYRIHVICFSQLRKSYLYCNLSEVTVDGKPLKSEAVLSLTSAKLKGAIDNFSSKEEISGFVTEKQHFSITANLNRNCDCRSQRK